MIEVEKRFQPTEEQLNAMIKDAEFLGEKTNTDIYYDYSNYSLFKQNIRFRNRNGNFELKLGKSSGVAEEIEDESEIKKYFNTNMELDVFVLENMIPFMEYGARRMKYKKDGFVIDVDEMSYGYNMTEIEILVDDESKIQEAENKILDFAKSYNFEIKDFLPKRAMYLKMIKPDLYKELYN